MKLLLVVAVVAATTLTIAADLYAQGAATSQHVAPLSVARQGYLFAGGKYSTADGRQIMSG